MNHSPANVLRYCLIAEGGGSLPEENKNWPIYVNKIPDEGDSVISVMNRPGKMDGRYMKTVTTPDNSVRSGQRITHPGWQIIVRSKDEETTWARAMVLCILLDEQIENNEVEVKEEDGSFSYYILQSVTRTTDPIPIGEAPERRREVVSINGILTLKPKIVVDC